MVILGPDDDLNWLAGLRSHVVTDIKFERRVPTLVRSQQTAIEPDRRGCIHRTEVEDETVIGADHRHDDASPVPAGPGKSRAR